MTKRRIILWWLVLLVPTLIVGGLALMLLRHEQERLEQTAAAAVTDKARVVAEEISLAVTTVQASLTDSLGQIPEGDLLSALRQWRQSHPLVRNAFLLDPDVGLLLPDPAAAWNKEEEGFVGRYAALFTGRIPWQRDRERETPDEAPATSLAKQNLFRLAAPANLESGKTSAGAQRSISRSGWIPWFEANQLFLLGWVEAEPGGVIYGIELETVALLSRLVTVLPSEVQPGRIYTLLDGAGRIMHQSGVGTVSDDAVPYATVPIGRALPHWQVAVYLPQGLHGTDSGKGFLVLSSLMVVIFAVTILSGGALLLWQAHRNLLDARRKTSFVSNVSHELKTPLTTIRMYAELLSEGRVREEEKRRSYLDVIVSESQRLTRLVNNVLDFSRLEEKKKTYNVVELDVVQGVNEVLDAQSLRIHDAGMELQRLLPDHSVIVQMDRDALEQVLLNILDNAVKYAADGKEIRVGLEPRESGWVLTVADRGPGVPRSTNERIFEHFYRADSSLTTRHPGSGLGLSIARRLLRDLDGDLTCEPNPGGGARFVIRLPGTGEESR